MRSGLYVLENELVPTAPQLCGESVWATRSEDRFPVGAKFSVLVET